MQHWLGTLTYGEKSLELPGPNMEPIIPVAYHMLPEIFWILCLYVFRWREQWHCVTTENSQEWDIDAWISSLGTNMYNELFFH